MFLISKIKMNRYRSGISDAKMLERRVRKREIASSALGWNQMVGGRVRDAGSQVNNK